MVITLLRPAVRRSTLIYIREYLMTCTSVYIHSEISGTRRLGWDDFAVDITSVSYIHLPALHLLLLL